MHNIQMYENLTDMLEREVKEISNKNQIDTQTLDNLYKIMMSLKATDKHMEKLEGGMSRNSYDMNRARSYGGSYGSYDGMSGTMRDRDSDGRYNESRDNFRNRSYRGRESYENSYGYSRDNSKRKMVQKLETLMDDTMSEYDRNAIMDCIDKIK